ncbi:hypothetical protein CSIM01_12967 [Colletotrichum simmondsii]|uniref:Protein kinase domain-containing protein n=1 Tax=Colletotrichum simmondsii TaxID=703756 RepID=A0A135RQL2_9PEZI|nr:hypothetical protein CSIM01_12967 [Colletotrichum simmondsii]
MSQHNAPQVADRNIVALKYKPRQKLVLSPHEPSAPFGSADFPSVPEGHQLRSLKPAAEARPTKRASLEIVDAIRAGADVGSQILLCKIVHIPSAGYDLKKHAPFPTSPKPRMARREESLVVAKVFDPRLYPPRDPIDLPNEPPFDDATVAYSELCREAAVYQFFYEKGKSGHPHMIAQYYGCWVTNRKVFNNASTLDEWVGLILIEYIEGRSIENICPVDPITGYLEPPLNTEVILHLDTESEQQGKSLKLDRQVCLDVMKSLLSQGVDLIHLGVSMRYMLPHDVFLTIRNNGHDLETPRVVLLDHTFSVVWEQSRPGKNGIPAPFSDLELPPHPWEQCCVSAISEFLGWIPPQWDDREWLPAKTSSAATSPAIGRASDVPGVTEETGIAKSFSDWLLDCFGPLDDSNPKYTVFPEEVSDSGEEDEGELGEEEKSEPDFDPPGQRWRPTGAWGISGPLPMRTTEAEPIATYLGGLIIRDAAGSGWDSDNEQPPPTV